MCILYTADIVMTYSCINAQVNLFFCSLGCRVHDNNIQHITTVDVVLRTFIQSTLIVSKVKLNAGATAGGLIMWAT